MNTQSMRLHINEIERTNTGVEVQVTYKTKDHTLTITEEDLNYPEDIDTNTQEIVEQYLKQNIYQIIYGTNA